MATRASAARAAGAAPPPPPQAQLLQQLTSVGSLSDLKDLLEAHEADLVHGELGAMALLTAAQMEPMGLQGADEEAAGEGADDEDGGYQQPDGKLAAEVELVSGSWRR
jgi:hypothetical protein